MREEIFNSVKEKALSIAQVMVVVIVLLQLVTGTFLDLAFGLLNIAIVYFVAWAEKKRNNKNSLD